MAVYYPYANDPSKKTVLLELLALLIILTAIPAWLGGTFAIFIAAYTVWLGVWGLFGSWPRRHAIMMGILAIILMILIIINLILAATNNANCIPNFQRHLSQSIIHRTSANGTDTIVRHNRWCGSRIATYITHGLLLAWLLPFMVLAFWVAKEEREWERGGHTAKQSGVGHTRTTTTTTTTTAMGTTAMGPTVMGRTGFH